jgi:hypothetical protein
VFQYLCGMEEELSEMWGKFIVNDDEMQGFL